MNLKTKTAERILAMLYRDWYSIREIASVYKNSPTTKFDKNVWRYMKFFEKEGFLNKKETTKTFTRTRYGKEETIENTTIRYKANAKPFMLFLEEKLADKDLIKRMRKDEKILEKILTSNFVLKMTKECLDATSFFDKVIDIICLYTKAFENFDKKEFDKDETETCMLCLQLDKSYVNKLTEDNWLVLSFKKHGFFK